MQAKNSSYLKEWASILWKNSLVWTLLYHLSLASLVIVFEYICFKDSKNTNNFMNNDNSNSNMNMNMLTMALGRAFLTGNKAGVKSKLF